MIPILLDCLLRGQLELCLLPAYLPFWHLLLDARTYLT